MILFILLFWRPISDGLYVFLIFNIINSVDGVCEDGCLGGVRLLDRGILL